MCIKDPINKTCWRNGKDLSNGAPKIKLWNNTKKRIFRFSPKISAGHGWSWKFFFANFQTLGPLGCQGWVVIPQNVKKVKIRAPYCTFINCLIMDRNKIKCQPFNFTNNVSWVRACLSIWLERFRGSQKEDERGPFRLLFLYVNAPLYQHKCVFAWPKGVTVNSFQHRAPPACDHFYIHFIKRYCPQDLQHTN